VRNKAILTAVLATSICTLNSFGEGGRAVSGPAGGGARSVTNGASNNAPAPANNGASNNTQAPAGNNAASTPGNTAQTPANNGTANNGAASNGTGNTATNGTRTGQDAGNQPNTNGSNETREGMKKDGRREGQNDPNGQRDGARDGVRDGARREQEQNRPTVISVPGYGNVDWYGNYHYPYWNGWGNTNGYYNNNNTNNRASSDANSNSVNNPVSSNRTPGAAAESGAARERMENQLESTGSYSMAIRELNEAQANYDRVIAKLRRNLSGSSDYREAANEKNAASREVNAVQSKFSETAVATTGPSTKPVPKALVAAAQSKLDAASELSDIVKEQAAKDPEVKAARARLDAALAKVAAMKNPSQGAAPVK
jgi:hypothetical protein